MRLLRLFSLVALILALSAGTAPARDPVLTILFTGNTEGHAAPCPS